MPLLNVALVPGPDQVVVRVTGEADLSSAGLLADALAQAATLGTPTVVVDVAGVVFWDCSGLHALGEATADLARAGRRCRIVGATPATRRLVVLAGFTPALVLDGPVHLPAVAGAPVAVPVVERPVVERPVVERPVVERPVVERPVVERHAEARRRPPVVEHPAPTRRRATDGTRGGVLTLRRWR